MFMFMFPIFANKCAAILKFAYKQSKSEELQSTAKGRGGSAQHRQNQRSPTQSPFCHWTSTPSHDTVFVKSTAATTT